MNQRPISITIIGLFIAVGVVSLGYHVTAFHVEHPFEQGLICLVRLLAL